MPPELQQVYDRLSTADRNALGSVAPLIPIIAHIVKDVVAPQVRTGRVANAAMTNGVMYKRSKNAMKRLERHKMEPEEDPEERRVLLVCRLT